MRGAALWQPPVRRSLPRHARVQVASSAFLVLVSLAAAAGFVTYGGRLWLMLHRFPIESPGRLKKLREARSCRCPLSRSPASFACLQNGGAP